ncbi:MAG: HlyD family efflux transporter periplasmic adaptor subunit [Rhodoplanes sp.]|uniref:HlyD family secretion protein n=1 Tax=Rhodoplanes sp. TaxID=1968906 RepID=UPI00183D3829|nr:HlyD family efflux transporter periplasmic adaptor subunit [Rhodoplanes sp.]NVO14859.1 HlyD family efflux transporter periplasmic adaptor subunit [Rhodoplanes sp.]
MPVRVAAVVVFALTLFASLPTAGPAQAQSTQPGAAARAESAVRSLIARLRGNTMPDGIVKSNGRIEATQVDIAAKYGGRLATMTVEEGDEVTAGQVVATISSPEYEAQLRGAQAQVLRAKQALAEAVALIAQRTSDVNFARTDLERGKSLLEKGSITVQVVDQRRNKFEAADAAFRAATAQHEQAQFAIKVAEADVERLQSVLVDLVLVSPRSGRVQYRLARAGEVVATGQRVLTILDLKDVYLTIYLPAEDAGKLTLGDEARIIADPIPEYVIPATVAFVATEAQFTPKSVETAEERQKLMFRVKLQVDPDVLQKYHRQVKTGVRGVGFARTSATIAWPEDLVVKLPK